MEDLAGEVSSNSDSMAGKYWRSHYDSMANHRSVDLFVAEARDYLGRLEKSIALSQFEHVLDFGCGLGFVSELLSQKVDSLFYWDYSQNMLNTAEARLASVPNARSVDLSGPGSDSDAAFNLIIVNSVIQYMSEEDLALWLRRWRSMLRPEGVLLISDIVLPERAFFREVTDSLKFSMKEGLPARFFLESFAQFARYLMARSHAPMSRYSIGQFTRLAENAELSVNVLTHNLTYRSNRFSVSLRTS